MTTPLDPEIAAQVRQLLGLTGADADLAPDLAAAAQAVYEAAASATLGGPGALLLAVALTRQVRDAAPGGWATLADCRLVLASAWPVETVADLSGLAAALLALAAAGCTDEELDAAAREAGELP
jgi:hypothetical protein